MSFAGDINFDDTWVNMLYYHENGDDITKCIDPDYIAAMNAADVMWINILVLLFCIPLIVEQYFMLGPIVFDGAELVIAGKPFNDNAALARQSRSHHAQPVMCCNRRMMMFGR